MNTPAARPRILIARAVFPEVIDKLAQHFDVATNPSDDLWPRDELIRRLQGKQGVFTTGSERIDADLLKACPDLKICANMAVGYNNFDVPAMTTAGVLATNAPGVLTETTADMGFALLMAAARRVAESEHFLRAGKWDRWAYDMMIGQDVHGSTLGILGMGRIGQAIARRGALGFGMQVIYHNRSRLPEGDEAEVKARYVSKEELLKTADHVVLVVPYSKESHHTIGAAELALMKPTAVLVNIARGGIVDDMALAAALREGRIAAAGLDVFEGEPKVHPDLLACTNVVLTPHIGSATVPTRKAMANLAADNLIGYLTQSKPVTPLNPEVIGAR
ncbi:D-glycerate dehydrogenase [Ottowia sp.]|uniref:2-hydroxyacid dehydrogenase n=1 Tax=Ottowia sp. TaxID=1898956 RepID=UPI002D11E72F|nr:D-glycerate dehydrogenase [Ottowia sp.]HOB67868.1 D-glycerate dehydrogenase [Ottowia sp.]HPZ58874.1 D-glycerate dehydrogenase [Ottowia sp.]HQD47903.1 D-glycerate dehydrogenase [Ottowia sp.]